MQYLYGRSMKVSPRLVPVFALSLVLAACAQTPTSSGSASSEASEPAASESTAAATTDSTAQGKDSITLALGHEHSDSFNPLAGWAQHGFAKFYDGLISHNEKLEPVPALASELPTVSDDGLTVTAKLRDGVKFHDGSTFEAEDVVATYKAILDENGASELTGEFPMLESVEAPDDMTVVFKLKHQFAPFVHLLATSIVPSEMAKPGTPVTELELNTNPVGTGPYKLETLRDKQDATLVANEDYWGTVPSIKTVNFVITENEANLTQRFNTGEIDGADLPPRIAEQVTKSNPDLELLDVPSVDYRMISLPMDSPVTGDLDVRKAMNLAVNRQAMVDSLLAGHGTPASTAFSPAWSPWYNKDTAPEFDVDQANKILDDAGWSKGSDGIREKGGQKATFTVMFPQNDEVRRDLALAFAQDMKAIGIDVKTEGTGWDVIKPRLSKDGAVFGGGNPYDPDLQVYQLLHSKHAGDGWSNPGHYKNAKVDELLDKARNSTDQRERESAYQEIQTELMNDPSSIYLVFLNHTYVQRKGFEGYKEMVDPHAHGVTSGPWWNLEEWKANE